VSRVTGGWSTGGGGGNDEEQGLPLFFLLFSTTIDLMIVLNQRRPAAEAEGRRRGRGKERKGKEITKWVVGCGCGSLSEKITTEAEAVCLVDDEGKKKKG
jgi:hypothetical protein